MRMKAAVLHQQGLPRPYVETKPLVIEEVELDPPGPGEVLIEIAAAGLCHSDLSTIENLRPRPMPIIIGHEGAGVIRETGPDVHGLQKGDHVVCLFVASCGDCRPCRKGRPNICEGGFAARAAGTLPSGAKRLKLNGEFIHHNSGLSLFAQYAVVDQSALVKIPKDVPLADAALFGCAVMTGAGAVLNTAGLRAGEEIGVVGLGGVGMSALLAAVAAGASRVVAVDMNPAKLELARQWGATHAFDARDPDCAVKVREATSGGLDTVIETAGAIPALQLAYAIAARGGEVITAGLPHVNSAFPLPAFNMVSEEKAVRGSYMGSCVPTRDIPKLLGMYRRGTLPVTRLQSGTIALEEINAGFDRLAAGETLRQMLLPNG